MIKIDTNIPLLDLKGQTLKDSAKEEYTIGKVISVVLSGRVSNPHRGYMLAKKFATEDVVELKVEDAAFIKEELEKNGKDTQFGFAAIVIGQALEIIDGGEDSKEEKKPKSK